MTSGIRVVGRRSAILSATVGIPVSPDGTVGRKCPSCRRYFKVDAQRLGTIERMSCPYCGNEAPRDEFLTLDQLRRIRSAFARLAMDEVAKMLDKAFLPLQRTSGPVQIRYERGRVELPPLLTYLEEETVREKTCGACGGRSALYGIALFCPFCGRRDSLESFVESIEVARALLAAAADLPAPQRQILQAKGGEDRLAENALGDVVTAFEVFCRSRVEEVKGAAALQTLQAKHGRNVFQRLDEAIPIMEAQLGTRLSTALSASEWNELRLAFASRHVLTHNLGIADAHYVASGGVTPLGQRVQITRSAAERALALIERLAGGM